MSTTNTGICDIMLNKEKILSPEIIEKQKLKGTYDSPCLSVCDYDELTSKCQTCGMLKTEKTAWKQGDPLIKKSILENIEKRNQLK